MKSRAAVLFEVGQKLEVREVDVQDPGPGEVRIRMVAGGVCHSEGKLYDISKIDFERLRNVYGANSLSSSNRFGGRRS